MSGLLPRFIDQFIMTLPSTMLEAIKKKLSYDFTYRGPLFIFSPYLKASSLYDLTSFIMTVVIIRRSQGAISQLYVPLFHPWYESDTNCWW